MKQSLEKNENTKIKIHNLPLPLLPGRREYEKLSWGVCWSWDLAWCLPWVLKSSRERLYFLFSSCTMMMFVWLRGCVKENGSKLETDPEKYKRATAAIHEKEKTKKKEKCLRSLSGWIRKDVENGNSSHRERILQLQWTSKKQPLSTEKHEDALFQWITMWWTAWIRPASKRT